MMDSLDNVRIGSRYTELVKSKYKKSVITGKLEEYMKTEPRSKNIKQDDAISPKLCTLIFGDVFKVLDWEEKGIRIDGEYPKTQLN